MKNNGVLGVLLTLGMVAALLCCGPPKAPEEPPKEAVVEPVSYVEVLPKKAPAPAAEPLAAPKEEIVEPDLGPKLWGKCRVTAYCPCEKCCGKWARNRPVDANGQKIVTGASGKRLLTLKACASSLPFGTKLYIPELDLHVTVEDRAAKSIHNKYNGMYVDLFIDNHAQCYKYLSGHNAYMEVYIEK